MHSPIHHTSVDVLNPFLDVSSPRWLLIVAPDEFMPALQQLVQHKNQTGMPTVAISISSLTPFFEGVDQPEVIKRAIQYAHENLDTRYVMLVGDAHRFPVRFEFWHNLTSYSALTDHPQEWTNRGVQVCDPLGDWFASDLYYANLYHHEGVYP